MDRQAGTWVAEREVGLYRYLSKLWRSAMRESE